MIMTDARYTVYIDKAYRNYMIEDAKILPNMPKEKMTELGYGLTHEEFINKCQTDDDFADRVGCKIVIKELSLEERNDYYTSRYLGKDKTKMEELDRINIPTKLITVIYTEKIENYV